MGKNVLVVGGGIAGLVTAFELSESESVQVTLLEAASECGGKMRGHFDRRAGRFVEHSIRALGSTYFSFFDILDRANLLDRLSPVDAYLFYERESGRHVALDRREPLDVHAVADLVKTFGLSRRDMLHLAERILHHVNASSEEREALSRLEAGEAIGIESFDAPTRQFIVNWFGILTGARMHSKAVDIMDSFLLMFLPMSESPTLPPGPHSKSYCFDRPTSEVVDALVETLRARGVEIVTGCLQTGLAAVDDGTLRVRTADGALEDRSFDAAVMAVPHEVMWKQGFIAAPEPFSDEWSFGSQFPLHSLPDVLAPFAGKSYNLCFDAPWNIVFQIQHNGSFWSDVTFPSRYPWNLSATCSTPHGDGSLFGKPFGRCTPEEAMHEVLHQLGIADEAARDELVARGTIDPIYLDFTADWQRHADTETVEFGALHEDGRRWVDKAQIYVRSAEDPDIAPASATPGVFLAGEVVTVPGRWKIPTMEQASTSGKQAAQLVFDHLRIPVRVSLEAAKVERKALAGVAELFLKGVNALDDAVHR